MKTPILSLISTLYMLNLGTASTMTIMGVPSDSSVDQTSNPSGPTTDTFQVKGSLSTVDECEKFVQQLKRSVTELAAKAGRMPGRTDHQCSNHWDTLQDEKRYQKKKRFSLDEDELLKLLVKKHETEKWTEIAKQMPNRSPEQCRRRWEKYLSPLQNPWTDEEDTLLLEQYCNLGPKWATIAKRFFPHRRPLSVKNRWHQLNCEMPARSQNQQDPAAPTTQANQNSNQNTEDASTFNDSLFEEMEKIFGIFDFPDVMRDLDATNHNGFDEFNESAE